MKGRGEGVTMDALLALSALRAMSAGLGAIMVGFGLRAYLRTRRPTMLWFTSGIAVATFGFLIEGALFQWMGWPLESAAALESSLTLVAFAMLVGSLFVADRRRMPAKPAATHEPTLSP